MIMFMVEKEEDESVSKQSSRQLSARGKITLMKAIDEYVGAKIDICTLAVRPHLDQEQVEERYAKAADSLKGMIDAIVIQLEV